jgi:hypothetical protein
MHRWAQLARIAALSCAAALLAAPNGCAEETCEGNCAEQYDDCLARSPPGASKADCGAEYDRCLQYCSSVQEAPEDSSYR